MKKQIHANAQIASKKVVYFITKLITLSVLMCAFLQTPAFAWDADHSNWKSGAVDRNFEYPKGTHQW